MKIIPLSLYIALRFRNSSKKNKTISFISIVSIISTSLGVALLIITLSVINGFNKELNEKILSIIPHGEIEPLYQKFSDWITILNQIKNIQGITQAVPYVHFSGLIEKKNKFHPIQIRGIYTLCNIHPKIITYLSSKKTLKSFSPNKQIIILGKGVSTTLSIQKNEWIKILIHNPNSKNNFIPYKKIQLKVIDILNLKNHLDHNIALIPLLDAQNYSNQTQNISGISIKVDNIFNIDKILKEIEKIVDYPLTTRSWINIYKYIYQDLQLIKKIIYLTMTLFIITACFGVISILTLTVKEKNRDITILRTLGGKNNLIYNIFIWYNLLNSTISILIGGTFGILISLNLTRICSIIENIYMSKILDNNPYFINFLPSELQIKDVIIIFSIEVFLNLLITLYPIIRINHTHPTKILK